LCWAADFKGLANLLRTGECSLKNPQTTLELGSVNVATSQVTLTGGFKGFSAVQYATVIKHSHIAFV
jgi:hypothetical protein